MLPGRDVATVWEKVAGVFRTNNKEEGAVAADEL